MIETSLAENTGITAADRLQELNVLVSQMRDHPSQDWDWARQRAMVLRRMIAAGKAPGQHAPG